MTLFGYEAICKDLLDATPIGAHKVNYGWRRHNPTNTNDF
jgi:hypothetical protein